MPITPIENIEVPQKSAAGRRAVRGHGITGLTLELHLVHLQNIALVRDEIKNYLESPGENKSLRTDKMFEDACRILDFIVQKDFQSPIAEGLWGYDPRETFPTNAKY